MCMCVCIHILFFFFFAQGRHLSVLINPVSSGDKLVPAKPDGGQKKDMQNSTQHTSWQVYKDHEKFRGRK